MPKSLTAKYHALSGNPHWLSFGTARRKVVDTASPVRGAGERPSHFERSLQPALPGLPLGVSRRFGAAACVPRRRLA